MRFFNVLLMCTLVGLFTLASCTDGTKAKAVTEKAVDMVKPITEVITDPPNTVPLKEARGWAATWEKAFSSIDVQGWVLPADDLRDILDEKVDSARFYIGQIESTGEFKLVIVGVDRNGNDMLDSTATPPQLVYDLSTPCPTACGAFIPGD